MKFKEQKVNVESEVKRIDELTASFTLIFNDFNDCFNGFVEREARLETLHTQAIRKSKELNKKVQIEVMA